MTSAHFSTADEAIKTWSQGDLSLDENAIVFRFNPKFPATDESETLSDGEDIYAEFETKGLVVVTQTCDIVRPIANRPFVEVCPLVQVDASTFSMIRKRTTPRYAEVPSLSDSRLVADLDMVMTVEKPVLLNWNQTVGCRTDDERRRFSEALARKRARSALPDTFVILLKPLSERIKKASKKSSEESVLLGAFQEIRVQPSPDWSANVINVHFWFILERGANINQSFADEQLRAWMKLVPSSDQYKLTQQLVTYDDLSAAEYLASDQLDFDHLS